MLIGPARCLLRQHRQIAQRSERGARHVEDHVVARPREPEHRVVLRRRHREAVAAEEGLVETGELLRHLGRSDLFPELRPEARDEVDSAHRRPRLAERRDRCDEVVSGRVRCQAELEVGVRRRPEREDPTLRVGHVPLTPVRWRVSLPSAIRDSDESLREVRAVSGSAGEIFVR